MSEGLYERSIMIEPAYAGNVFGELDCFAKRIERSFHVTIVERNGSVKVIGEKNAVENAVWYDNCGADGLFYCDESSFAGDHTDTKTIKAICAAVDIPLYVCGKVNRFEDIKKMIG